MEAYVDASKYGMYFNSTPPSTIASCISGSTAVTLAAALDFQDASAFPTGIGNGIVIHKCGAISGLRTPPAPTVTPYGILNGSTTYSYQFVAEDLSGGLTAASPVGVSTNGATLGFNTIALTGAVWNSTLNGQQIYACWGIHNLSLNAPITISGFSTAHFNGNYTVIAIPDPTHFVVASPQTPTVTSETKAATAMVLAYNILTMPALSVPNVVEGGGDTVLRWWVYRNGTLAFCVQARDPYYEDAGVNLNLGIVPRYIPTTPPVSAQNKYLAATIVSGGGTKNIVVADPAGNTLSGQLALHDNSQNLLAALSANRNSMAVQIPWSSNPPFNATTNFSNSKTSNTKLYIPSLQLNQPWVINTSGIVFEGASQNQGGSFVFDTQVRLSGNALPLVLSPNTFGASGWKFKNISFSANQLQQVGFVWDYEQSAFGLMMDNVSFGARSSSDNLNTPAAIFKGITESNLGMPGNRNSCGAPQISGGPPCLRFTTVSTAIQNSQVSIAGNIGINGFSMQGGGSSYQFDSLPFVNSGGNPSNVSGVTQIYIITGLREIGHGPFIRLITPQQGGSFWIKNVDDDAPNAAPGNGFVDNSYSTNGLSSFDFEDIMSSVSGQVLVAGRGKVFSKSSVFSAGTTESGFVNLSNFAGTGNVSVSGTSTVGFAMPAPPAPTVTLGAPGSCSSSCVAAGTYKYQISARDTAGHYSPTSPATSVTTDGTQTITVSWVPVPGQVSTYIARNGLFNDRFSGAPVNGTSFTDANFNSYSCSTPGCQNGISGALSSGMSANGISTSVLMLAPTPYVALGTPQNGVIKFCPDWDGGTGAYVRGLNGLWVCI